MLTHFPKFFSTRAIICYLVTLTLVSVFYINHAMPFQFMLFGIVPVLLFFTCANQLTLSWRRVIPRIFVKRLFIAALLIRVVYVVFIYYYYIEMTGKPHAFSAGDELFYDYMGKLLKDNGFAEFRRLLKLYGVKFSDSGYTWWLAIEYSILGPGMGARIVKGVLSAYSCVLMYNLAKRNFGEYVGRMTAVMCMLILKEAEMTFMVVLFVERADAAFHAPKVTLQNILLPALVIFVMFTFRTVLASVMIASLAASLIFASGKQMQVWKKVLYGAVFAVWIVLTTGVEIAQEVQQYWEGRETNQSLGYEEKFGRLENSSFQKYATATVFAPLIFTIPFSSMVEVPGQEVQMMFNGSNFIKNVMSGFIIYAMVYIFVSGKWRLHVLPMVTIGGYLVVLVFSNFAHSERFHFPVLPLELMFAAYGLSLMRPKHKRWMVLWLIGVCVMEILWNWVKLSGRGWA